MRRYLLAIISATAVAASFVPSQAAGYEVSYGAVRGVTANVKLAGGGTATASLTQFDVVAFTASGTARPNPASDHFYMGCITVKTSVGTDGSCKVLTGAAISLDPSLSTVTAAWSVDSVIHPGQAPPVRVYASLIMTGSGAPTPYATPALTPTGADILLQDGPQIGRSGTVIGFVRSEAMTKSGKRIGGGAITATNSATSWYGLGGFAHIHNP